MISSIPLTIGLRNLNFGRPTSRAVTSGKCAKRDASLDLICCHLLSDLICPFSRENLFLGYAAKRLWNRPVVIMPTPFGAAMAAAAERTLAAGAASAALGPMNW